MKVLLTAIAAPPGITGVQRHAINAVKSLLRRPEIRAVHLVVADWQYEAFASCADIHDERYTLHRVGLRSGLMHRNLWHIFQLPRFAKRFRVDVIHLTYPVPVLRKLMNAPVVVTLHDLYPFAIPENFGKFKSLFNRTILRLCLDQATAIACVSDATREALEATLPRCSQRAVRIYNAVTSAPGVATVCSSPRWPNERFLLCVAQHRKNKNVSVLLRALRQLLDEDGMSTAAEVIVVGAKGPETSALKKEVATLRIASKVFFFEDLSESQLQWFYRNAAMLVAPSSVEGFGLPVVEALAFGCPVVCSDIRAFREIGRGHCHYVPLDTEAPSRFAEAIRQTLLLSRPAPLSMAKFSLDTIGGEYLSLYSQLVLSRTAAGSMHVEASTL